MSCPFLRDTRVRTCHAASVRKPIANLGAQAADEKCSGAGHASCEVFQGRGGETAGACPHLEEALVQYCGASPVAHYVPYSTAEVSRCGTEAYRFCEAYLTMARPAALEGVTVPARAHLAPNHLWLDESEGGLCHVGIDSLLARLLGRLERISFLTTGGARRPSAVVTVCGVDWPLVFPNPLLIESANAHLRADPSRITCDPYGAGWLFSGYAAPGAPAGEARRNLLQGRPAAAWLAQESTRLSEWMQRRLATRQNGLHTACDGGWIAEGAAHLLRRDELLDVLHEFFAPHAGWTKES